MFEDTFTTSTSVFLMVGISFCVAVIPYLIAQIRVNQKDLDKRKSLAKPKEVAN